MPDPSISSAEGARLVAESGGIPHRSCCGSPIDDAHKFDCHSRPQPCPECSMTGFHRPQCSHRTVTAENPKHYEHPSGVETIQVNRCMTFCAGSAFKYILRYEDKSNPPEDLRKARWYVADVEEFEDPIWISAKHKVRAIPLLVKMLEHELNPYRRWFFTAVLDLDVDAMAEAVEAARESVA